MASEKIFSAMSRRIIGALYRLARWATINEVADEAEVSWNTAKAALSKLRDVDGVVVSKRKSGVVYWKVVEEE